MDDAKAIYNIYCRQNAKLPIFFQDWWLDLVCGPKNWEVCLDLDKGGNIRGVLPYFLTKYLGLPIIKMPLFTPYLGVWFEYPLNLSKIHSKYSFEKSVSKNLVTQLPWVAFYTQKYYPSYQNWMGLYHSGFQETTRYTYVIENLKNHQSIFNHFHPKVRNAIRLAHDKGTSVEALKDVKQFYQINAQIFRRKAIKIPYSLAFLKKIDVQLELKNRRRIYCAKDASGRVLAIGYFILDEHSAYYMAGGSNPSFPNNEALTFLIWHAIQKLSSLVDRFDFEGSMLPEVELFFRSFGGQLQPYYKISKEANKLVKLAGLIIRK